MLTFNEEDDFHPGNQETGEGCLIWANASRSKRVRFFINRSILIDTLNCESAFANEIAIACCRRERSRIEAACRRAFARQPDDKFIALQAHDFQERRLGG
jgi:hypothetical protein